jgi:hypothetical protein
MLFEEYAFRPQIVQDAPHAIVLRVRAGVKCRRGMYFLKRDESGP